MANEKLFIKTIESADGITYHMMDDGAVRSDILTDLPEENKQISRVNMGAASESVVNARLNSIGNQLEQVESKADRVDEVANSIRGKSILSTTTAPAANMERTPDGKVHQMVISINTVKTEANVTEVFIGDTLQYRGYLYQANYIATSTDKLYLDSIGTIIGPKGDQGLQGEQGPQGPKGDPGTGYFIVSDEDYTIIADMVEEKSYHAYDRPDPSEPIRPNIFYNFGPQYHLEITFAEPSSPYRSNEYMFQFESHTDRPTTLILPDTVRWCYDPVIEAGKTYQVSVLNNLAVICGA